MTILSTLCSAIRAKIDISKLQNGLIEVSDESEEAKLIIEKLNKLIELREAFIDFLEKISPKISEDLLNNWAKKVIGPNLKQTPLSLEETEECVIFKLNTEALTLKLSYKNGILDQKLQKWMVTQWMDLANRWLARCMKPKVKKGLHFFSKGSSQKEKQNNDTNSKWNFTYRKEHLSVEIKWNGEKKA